MLDSSAAAYASRCRRPRPDVTARVATPPHCSRAWRPHCGGITRAFRDCRGATGGPAPDHEGRGSSPPSSPLFFSSKAARLPIKRRHQHTLQTESRATGLRQTVARRPAFVARPRTAVVAAHAWRRREEEPTPVARAAVPRTVRALTRASAPSEGRRTDGEGGAPSTARRTPPTPPRPAVAGRGEQQGFSSRRSSVVSPDVRWSRRARAAPSSSSHLARPSAAIDGAL